MGMPQVRNVLTQPGTTIILAPLPGSQHVPQPNASVLLPSTSAIMLSGPVGQQPASLIVPLKSPSKVGLAPAAARHHPPLLAPKSVLPKAEPLRPILQAKTTKKTIPGEETRASQGKEGSVGEVPRGPNVKSILPKVTPGDAHTLILVSARTPELLPSTFSAVVPSKLTLGMNLSSQTQTSSQEGGQRGGKRRKERKKKPVLPTKQQEKATASIGKVAATLGDKHAARRESLSKVVEKKASTKTFPSSSIAASKSFLMLDDLKSKGCSTARPATASEYMVSSQPDLRFPKQNLVDIPPPPYPKSSRNRSIDLVLQEVESRVQDWCSELDSQNPPQGIAKGHEEGFQASYTSQFNAMDSSASMKGSCASPLYSTNANDELKNCPTPVSSQLFSSSSPKANLCFSPPTSPVYVAPVTSQPKVTFSMMQHESLANQMSPAYSSPVRPHPASSSSSQVEDSRISGSCQPQLPSYSASSCVPQLNTSHSLSTSISQMNTSLNHSSSHYSDISSPFPENSSSMAIQKGVPSSTACFSFHSAYGDLSQANQTGQESSLPSITSSAVGPICNQTPNQSVYSYSSKSSTVFRESPQPFSQALTSPFYADSQQALQSEHYIQSPHQASYLQSPQPETFSHATHAVTYTQSPYTPPPHTALYSETPQSNIYSEPPHSVAYDQSKFFLRSENDDTFAQSPQPFTNSIASHQSPITNGHQSPQPASFAAGRINSYSESPQPTAYCNSPQSTPIPVQNSAANSLGSSIPSAPLLPSYSFSEHTPSNYLSSSSPISSSMYSSHHTSLTPNPQVCEDTKGIPTSAAYTNERVDCTGVERSHNPPSYEAHFQNNTAYTRPNQPDAELSQQMAMSALDSDLSSYPMGCHSPRFLEQDLADMQVDPRSCVRSPPAYPSLPSLPPPPPPPSYTSNPHIIPPVHSSPYPSTSVQGSSYPVTSTQNSQYPIASGLSNAINEYNALDSANTFFPNTPPVVPPSAATHPPMDSQPCLTQTSHSDSDSFSSCSNALSSSSFPSALYLPPGDSLEDFEDQESLLKPQSRNIRLTDNQQAMHKQYSHESSSLEGKGSKKSGAPGAESSQVHNIIERAERLWFIPHQEQNRAYIKRKELAKDFLNSSELQSRRDALLKEKFWIEEDEPIAQEIVLSATSSAASSSTNPSQESNPKDPKDSRDLKNGKDVRDEAMASTSTNALMLRAGHQHAQDSKGKKKRNREMLCQDEITPKLGSLYSMGWCGDPYFFAHHYGMQHDSRAVMTSVPCRGDGMASSASVEGLLDAAC
ncbi:proline-rich protein 36-like [Penaeus chinensis]|uniref:proline-rich protein 36-like n=1 Tax=Penaeus chinensis TaxID=139456 RepID=UPI001FB7C913|nr:proline-rich protein 36-like [Penaeus chinensis]